MYVSKNHFFAWYVMCCTRSHCSSGNINFIPCASAATTVAKRRQQHYKIFVFMFNRPRYHIKEGGKKNLKKKRPRAPPTPARAYSHLHLAAGNIFTTSCKIWRKKVAPNAENLQKESSITIICRKDDWNNIFHPEWKIAKFTKKIGRVQQFAKKVVNSNKLSGITYMCNIYIR